MRFTYNKLRGKIVEVCGTLDEFANRIGISSTALSKKLNNKIRISQDDVIEWSRLLHISPYEYGEYFFCLEGSDKPN